MFSLFAALLLGFQHSFEPDHVAGLASFANSSPYSTLHSALRWVAGHTAIVFAAALLLYLLGVNFVSTEKLDVVVGIVLIALAVNRLKSPAISSSPSHAGTLGLLHGLSGTGAFVALALASASSFVDVAVFSTLFGVGLAAGAVVGAFALAAPLAFLSKYGKFLNCSYAAFTVVVGLSLLF